MDRFHKALPYVKGANVTLENFTPDLQKIYTDISAESVTLCNSVEINNKCFIFNVHVQWSNSKL